MVTNDALVGEGATVLFSDDEERTNRVTGDEWNGARRVDRTAAKPTDLKLGVSFKSTGLFDDELSAVLNGESCSGNSNIGLCRIVGVGPLHTGGLVTLQSRGGRW